MVNFSPLAAEILSLVWGTPANFNGFRVLAALLHGQVTIIFVVSVCLFVCAEFFSAVFDPISIKLLYVVCLGLVVSPRI